MVGIPATITQTAQILLSHARQQQALRRNEREVPAADPRMLSTKVAKETPGTERDQDRVVSDLIEEFRAPFGDRLAIGLFGRGSVLDLDKEDHRRVGRR